MKKLLNNKYILIAGSLIIGLVLGGVFFSSSNNGEVHEHTMETADTEYTCSMHPQIRQKEPGSCPICGMALIPVEDSGSSNLVDAIVMSESAIKLANIVTMKVGQQTNETSLKLVGKVASDERRIFSQTSHIPGRIETLKINFTGDYVKSGETIGTLYSPDLVTAQKELLEANTIKSSQPALFEASKQKLKNWKLSDRQIDRIIASGEIQNTFPILADKSGYVFERKVNLGDHVTSGQELFIISDLSSVWVLFEVYEQDLGKVSVGQPLNFRVASLPSKVFEGKITYINPIINSKSRTATVRVETKNTNGMLKPEMLATAQLQLETSKKGTIQIPKSAVLWTGERSIVYEKVMNDEGLAFMLREVTLGQQTGDYYEVVEGLEAGQEIAVNGTFSIDAAAQLAGKTSMMSPKSVIKQASNVNKIPTSDRLVEPIKIDPKAKNSLKPLYADYLLLKNALVEDQFDKSQVAAKQLKTNLNKIDMAVFEGEAHAVWMQLSEQLKSGLEHAEHWSEIEQTRKAFIQISMAMIDITKTFSPLGEKLYVQYCPMANNDQGANWLSMEEEILNPYFGDAMLTCGNVEEELK